MYIYVILFINLCSLLQNVKAAFILIFMVHYFLAFIFKIEKNKIEGWRPILLTFFTPIKATCKAVCATTFFFNSLHFIIFIFGIASGGGGSACPANG